MRRASVVLLLTLVTTTAAAKDRPYDSLLVIQEDISITNVEASVVPSVSRNPTTVALRIEGMSACGEQILATQVDNVLRFYQIGKSEPHTQPGCIETIQYFWAPGDFDTAVDQSTIVKLSIPNETRGVEKSGFEVSVLAVKKRGELPDGSGVRIYFEYSQLKINKI